MSINCASSKCDDTQTRETARRCDFKKMNLNPELKIFVHINKEDLFLNGFLQQKSKVEDTMGTKMTLDCQV